MAGRIEVYLHSDATTQNKGGAIVEIACDTDFGARTEVFVAFCKKAARLFYAFGSWDKAAENCPEFPSEMQAVQAELRERIDLLEGRIVVLRSDSDLSRFRSGLK